LRHFFRCILSLLVIMGVPASPVFAQADRLDPIPVGPDDIIKALSPFHGNPDSSKVESLLEEQAERSGFPASDLDKILVARLWRRAVQPELALVALERIGAEADAANLAMYEAARVLLESGLNPRGGGQAYWLACGSLDERVRKEIEWDLLAVSTPDEREAWLSIAPGGETCDWLRDFWSERAQRMIIGRDERVAMHFRRTVEARRMYYLARPRFLHGMSNFHGRPDGLAVDDRGLLFMRLGPPDHDEACGELVAQPADTFPNLLGRCWAYEGNKGYQLFYLTTTDRFGQTRADSDFRIQENLGQLAEPGNGFFQKYVMNADISDGTKRELVRGGAGFRRARRGTQGLGLAGWQQALRNVEFQANRSRIRLDLRRFTSEVLEQVPDRPDIEITADLRFESLRFLNPSSRKWFVWLLGAVPARQLQPSDGDNPESTLNIAGRFSVMTPNGMSLEQITPLSIPVSALPPDAGISLRGSTSATPGPLLVSFVIEDLNAPGTGSWIQDTVNVPSVRGFPQLSDIAVAQTEGGTWTRDGETFLQLSPVHNTNPDGSIHTYFEVYGIRSGTKYDVEVRLIASDKAERIWRRQSRDMAFRLEFQSEMNGKIGRHHLRLELGDTKPGEYTLAVRVQDADSRGYSLPAVTDIFVAER